MHPKKALCLYLNTLQMPPLITHPTWIFLVMLCVILLTPIILRRLRIPHIIGLIVAGAVLGEHGLNVLARDTSIELFGQVGIYYIMFLAGLEMDMGSFRRHGSTGAVFGALTFLIPFALGMLSARYVLQMSDRDDVKAETLLSCGEVWLRMDCDFTSDTARFSYSTDGRDFLPLGTPFHMIFSMKHFTGNT